ncbi:hypothetical protein SUGI_0658970 [Cryptomeria japonica]|nr:hypothetical protein SUGI_0658970 [Cryptomeria japonica]
MFTGGDGFYYCQACGTQSQDFVEQKVNRTGVQSYTQLAGASDSDDDAMLRDFGSQNSFATVDPEALACQIREKYLDGMQIMIQMQCETLVKEFGVSPLICGVAGPIWLHFVASTHVLERGWAEESLEAADALYEDHNGRKDFDFKTRYQMDKKVRAEPRSILYRKKAQIVWQRSLKDRIPLTISLAISFLACHIAREAVLPTDMIKWVLEGKLPYLAAFVDIEKILSSVSSEWPLSAKFLLRPSRALSARQLELTSGCLAKRIGLQLPPVNFHSISRHFLRQLGLPVDKIFPALSNMYDWSLPPGLWLSADVADIPTRVYVMGMLVVVIRILYNIHGQGYFENSVMDSAASASDSSNKTCNQEFSTDQYRTSYRSGGSGLNDVNNKKNCLPVDLSVNQLGDPPTSLIGSTAHLQDQELDATIMLLNLETWHQDNTDRFDYGKDLPTYLKYCKDVIFAGAKMSYDEELLVRHFWQLYEKLEEEDIDLIQNVEGDPLLDSYVPNTRQKNISQSVDENNVSLYEKDCIHFSKAAGQHYPETQVLEGDVATNSEEIPLEGLPKFKDTGGDRLGNIIYDMEQNGFKYVPPLRSCPPDSYMSYMKKVKSGKSHVVVHADYYILLRACARVIKMNAFVLHRCILKIEKELGCIEERIAGILKENL